MWGEEWGRCREVCLGVGPQHTSPHLLPHLTFSYISLTSPTPQHTFLHLLSYLFPHLPFLPPYLDTFSYYSHISPHLLKVWRSYHVTKFLWRSYRYHVAKLLATDTITRLLHSTYFLVCNQLIFTLVYSTAVAQFQFCINNQRANSSC